MANIKIRQLSLNDLNVFYDLNKPSRLHHQYNGPYFKRQTTEELIRDIEIMRKNLLAGNSKENIQMIADNNTDELIGKVSWYWKSQETKWMEVGIVIFNENYWGKGIGFSALKIWIDKIFKEHNEIIRIGLTTWSGNTRMMKLSEKLGLKLEATYRKARIVDGKYYDSISYGILREEWDLINR